MKSCFPGFAFSFNRHQNCWKWREKAPDPNHQKLGHVIEAVGYVSQSHAIIGVRLELHRREETARCQKSA